LNQRLLSKYNDKFCIRHNSELEEKRGNESFAPNIDMPIIIADLKHQRVTTGQNSVMDSHLEDAETRSSADASLLSAELKPQQGTTLQIPNLDEIQQGLTIPEGEELTLLPPGLTYSHILKQLTPSDFNALRLVSRSFLKYMNCIDSLVICAPKRLKAEFPREAVVPDSKARTTYLSCLNKTYSSIIYYPREGCLFFDALQALLCGGFNQFFEQIKRLSEKDRYYFVHPGFPIGFFLLHYSKKRGLTHVVDELNNLSLDATTTAKNMEGVVGDHKSSTRRKPSVKKWFKRNVPQSAEYNFSETVTIPSIMAGLNCGRYDVIASSLSHLTTHQKFQFLIGIGGIPDNFLHYLCRNNSKKNNFIELITPLVAHIEKLCHSNPEYLYLLEPDNICFQKSSNVQPLFLFIALGNNKDFQETFDGLDFKEQCTVLT